MESKCYANTYVPNRISTFQEQMQNWGKAQRNPWIPAQHEQPGKDSVGIFERYIGKEIWEAGLAEELTQK